MKKLMITAVVIVTFCFALSAQQSVIVGPSVSESFNFEYKGAANVRWEKVSKDIFLARFDFQQKNSIAYFDKKGNLLMAGKRIDFNQAPALVQNGIEDVLKSYEKSNESLSVSHIYELNDNHATSYYSQLYNSNFTLALMSTSKGTTTIIKKLEGDFDQKSTPLLISIR